MKIYQNRSSEKIWFPTVKVAENLHTVSPQYTNEFACIRSLGVGMVLYANQKLLQQDLAVAVVLHYGHYFGFSTKNFAFQRCETCAKCVKTRQKCVLAALALLWSCLRQKIAVEGWVHMCGFGQT